MRVPLSWLREFCPVDEDAEGLAEALTAVGVKVEDLLRPWEGLRGVIVAEVTSVEDHPDSTKLCVVRIRTGDGEAVVCAGVRNVAPGDRVPYAPPGSRVPALAEPLEVRTLRGVRSEGMICSPRELGVSEDHEHLMVLPPDAPLGSEVAGLYGLDDVVFDIEIEPNRPDLMSVLGVSREAAAVTGTPMTPPDPAPVEGGEKASETVGIEIRDLERCPYYLARAIRGVRPGPSPVWVQARLTACGMRPINSVVDATNYVLLEIGHPLHPFDAARLEGDIVVRTAVPGERLVTLDGVERTLSEEDLLISDAKRGIAVAGVMGGAVAEVSGETRDVVLESAYFWPTGILRTSRRLRLSTEASMRFERGADPEAVRLAADRAAELIAEWSGGSVLAGIVEAGAVPGRRNVPLRLARIPAVLGGPPVEMAEAERRLRSVGFRPRANGDRLEVEVPGFRVDVEREIDLIEEILRLERGYEHVRSTLPAVRQAGGVPASYALRMRLREVLVALGLFEVKSLSFASESDLALMGDPIDRAVRVANPLAADEGFLRTRLTPGLLRALRRNYARHVDRVAIFEIGTVFRAADPVQELQKLGFALMGPAGRWPEPARQMDFFDGKGILESLMEALRITGWELSDPAPEPFHPGRSAKVLVDGQPVGVLGELHPSVRKAWEFPARVTVGVLSVDALGSHVSDSVAYREIPRFPPVVRDLAFLVDEGVAAGRVHEVLMAAGAPSTQRAVLFDVFVGDPLPPGSKNLAFRIEFRDPVRTLTDEEVDEVVGRIAERLRDEFGAALRG